MQHSERCRISRPTHRLELLGCALRPLDAAGHRIFVLQRQRTRRDTGFQIGGTIARVRRAAGSPATCRYPQCLCQVADANIWHSPFPARRSHNRTAHSSCRQRIALGSYAQHAGHACAGHATQHARDATPAAGAHLPGQRSAAAKRWRSRSKLTSE